MQVNDNLTDTIARLRDSPFQFNIIDPQDLTQFVIKLRQENIAREISFKCAHFNLQVIPKVWKTLSDSNWACIPFSATLQQIALIGEGSVEEVDDFMIQTMKDAVGEIRLLAQSSNRSKILLPAIDAHIREEYSLSVLPFIAQSEGLCRNLYGSAPSNNKIVKRNIDKDLLRYLEAKHVDCPLLGIYQYFFLNLPKIWGGDKKLEDHFRNAPMHGSMDYATEGYSLRALNFLWFFLHWEDALKKTHSMLQAAYRKAGLSFETSEN